MPARKPAAPRRIAAAEQPVELGRYIVADPRICHGKPTFRGTRIMVDNVLEMVAEGMPWDEIVYEWEGRVPHAAIAEAVELARRMFVQHTAGTQRKAS
jgi:uncharacterized protein (DUF433 family)